MFFDFICFLPNSFRHRANKSAFGNYKIKYPTVDSTQSTIGVIKQDLKSWGGLPIEMASARNHTSIMSTSSISKS